MLSSESIGLWINITEYTQSALTILHIFSFFLKYRHSLRQYVKCTVIIVLWVDWLEMKQVERSNIGQLTYPLLLNIKICQNKCWMITFPLPHCLASYNVTKIRQNELLWIDYHRTVTVSKDIAYLWHSICCILNMKNGISIFDFS